MVTVTIPFEELFGEKVCALAQRARPRDLYDVINLFRHGDFRNAAAVIRDIVLQRFQPANPKLPVARDIKA